MARWKLPAPGGMSDSLRGVFNSLSNYIDKRVCPAGTIRMSVSLVVEDGWLIMTGQTITNGRYLYPELWNKVGSDWKSGDNLVFPDFRNRFPISAASGAVQNDIGNLIGSNTTTIAAANLPAHTHGMNFATGGISANHTHGSSLGGNFVDNTGGGGIYAGGIGGSIANQTSAGSADHVHIVNGNTDNGPGSGTAMATYPESMYMQFMIRVF